MSSDAVEKVADAMAIAVAKMNLHLSMWGWGTCDKCHLTWDRCDCADREQRFNALWAERCKDLVKN